MLLLVLEMHLRPGSILDSHDELQVQEMINISQLTKRAHDQDIQVMVEGPGHVPLNEVAANVRLAKSSDWGCSILCSWSFGNRYCIWT